MSINEFIEFLLQLQSEGKGEYRIIDGEDSIEFRLEDIEIKDNEMIMW